MEEIMKVTTKAQYEPKENNANTKRGTEGYKMLISSLEIALNWI